MTLEQQARQLIKAGNSKIRVKYLDGHSATIRVFIGDHSGEVCQFSRRSSRRGYRLNFNQIATVSKVATRKTLEQKWRDAWTKIIKRLEVSGLWENFIPEIKIALDMGWDTIQQARKEYWEMSYGDDRQKQVDAYLEKYPALAQTRDDGTKYVNTTIVWKFSQVPRIKKMRFTKYCNDDRLSRIQEHMDKKEKCRESGTYSYDVSFEYNPETNRAWYSEEYRGCGNGHYYIALDATHAIYWEKD